MAKLKDLEKYLDYEFSTGSYPGEDYKSFQTKYINYLRSFFRENDWELVNVGRNHYEFSAFISDLRGKFIYLSISDVRCWRNEWYTRILIRTAKSEKNCHGGHNHFTSLPKLYVSVRNLLIKEYIA